MFVCWYSVESYKIKSSLLDGFDWSSLNFLLQMEKIRCWYKQENLEHEFIVMLKYPGVRNCSLTSDTSPDCLYLAHKTT